MTTTLTQQPLTPSQRQAFALGLTVALRQPVTVVLTDGPFEYRCSECGGTATDLTDAELRQMEMDAHCGADDCPGNACQTCGGDRGWVSGEDWVKCNFCGAG